MQTILMDMRRGVDAQMMQQAGEIIRSGGLVAFPTETVYGLGGDALSADASEKIYAAKGRPSDNPLIVHIADMDKLPAIVREVPEEAKALAKRFWPGPLTMILNKSDLVPEETTGGLQTVAVRMPDHPAALALIRAGGGYIAAPSANVSGRPSPTSAGHVMDDLDGRIEAVIDGGSVGIGLESTIIDLTGEVPTILRPGYVNRKMLEEVLGNVELDKAFHDPKEKPKAPGMKYRHYAPKADMKIIEGDAEDVSAYIRQAAHDDLVDGKKVGIIASVQTAADYPEGEVMVAGDRNIEITIAMHLYDILRTFDELETDVIYSEAFDTPDMGQAIMNRLVKAAGHQIIKV